MEEVERSLPEPDTGGSVLVTGASRRLPSLGLELRVAPLSISAASPDSIWRRDELR